VKSHSAAAGPASDRRTPRRCTDNPNAAAELYETIDGADRQMAEAFLTAEARREGYILNLAAEELYRQGAQRYFAIVAPSLHARGLSRFLTDTLGWTPRAIVVTDNPAPQSLVTAWSGLDEVHYSEDSGYIDDILLASGAEVVLGSAFERPVASQLGVPLIEVSFPTHRPVLSSGFGGFRGGHRGDRSKTNHVAGDLAPEV
jgi:nitrogenase molybdenum-iron protein beta chain